MVVVDTNILVYAVDSGSKEQVVCRQLLEELRNDPAPWYTTWGVLYEFLRVVTHPRVFRQPLEVAQAWKFVEGLLSSPNHGVLVEGHRHTGVARRTLAELAFLTGNIMHDAHTANLMREHGIRRIYTRDTDFHRFPFLEVVDPLSET